MSRLGVVALALCLAGGAVAGAALYGHRHIPVTPPRAPDYAQDTAWVCRPGRADVCARPVTTIVFASDGGRSLRTTRPDPAAPIDCFYLYPTVSRARAAYAPIEITPDIENVVHDQLAPFSPLCRPFAPLYRQVTAAGLPLLFGHERGVTPEVPYADVLAAWRHYLAHDNAGRGVLLVGHSQGSRQLLKLMAAEIDGKPIARRLVGAIVPGHILDVAPGARVGGTLRAIPLCARADETGCVVAYSTFPAGRPMSAEAWLGVATTPAFRDACVDPAALLGATRLETRLPVPAAMRDEYGADLVALPGIDARCEKRGRYDVLAVDAEPAMQPRLDRLAPADASFGLHSVDLGLTMGTLFEIVRRQTATYTRRDAP